MCSRSQIHALSAGTYLRRYLGTDCTTLSSPERRGTGTEVPAFCFYSRITHTLQPHLTSPPPPRERTRVLLLKQNSSCPCPSCVHSVFSHCDLVPFRFFSIDRYRRACITTTSSFLQQLGPISSFFCSHGSLLFPSCLSFDTPRTDFVIQRPSQTSLFPPIP